MTMIKLMKSAAKTAPTARVAVSSPTAAVKVLRDYMRSVDFTTQPYYTVGTSKARWTSVAQIVSWFKANRNIEYNAGWLGRSLNAAQADGLSVTATVIKTSNQKSVTVYRNAKS
jgi:hypothetical protein